MNCFEGAKLLTTDELKGMIEEKCQNPTIERLVFIEAKYKEDPTKPSKTFPCWIEAWGEPKDKNMKPNPGLLFQATIAQSLHDEFSMVTVQFPASDLGVTKRIWDKPPTKGLREETPWVEGEVQ